MKKKIAIIGVGNIGAAIANGLLKTGTKPNDIILSRRQVDKLEEFRKRGCGITSDNIEAVSQADVVILSVKPSQIDGVLAEIGGSLASDELLISVVTAAEISAIKSRIQNACAVVRGTTNTAVTIGLAVTCISALPEDESHLKTAQAIFDTVGKTLVIEEKLMPAATALFASGIAVWLEIIRGTQQAAITLGFTSSDALALCTQTALGAASLIEKTGLHPEQLIDQVCSPGGCTIDGLATMKQKGFTHLLILLYKSITNKAASLYRPKKP